MPADPGRVGVDGELIAIAKNADSVEHHGQVRPLHRLTGTHQSGGDSGAWVPGCRLRRKGEGKHAPCVPESAQLVGRGLQSVIDGVCLCENLIQCGQRGLALRAVVLRGDVAEGPDRDAAARVGVVGLVDAGCTHNRCPSRWVTGMVLVPCGSVSSSANASATAGGPRDRCRRRATRGGSARRAGRRCRNRGCR